MQEERRIKHRGWNKIASIIVMGPILKNAREKLQHLQISVGYIIHLILVKEAGMIYANDIVLVAEI